MACVHSPSQHAQDLFICGFPCQPNSILRTGRFRRMPPATHRLYDVSHMVIAALHRNLPRAAILENVMGMTRRSAAEDGPDELTKFSTLIEGHGKYHFAAVRVTLGAWTAAERERLYMLLLRKDVGGEDCLKRAIATVQAVVARRRAEGPPTPLEEAAVSQKLGRHIVGA